MASCATDMKCDFKRCSEPLVEEDARVEVCSVLPRGFESRPGFMVLWRENGEAKFHAECWAKLAKAARSWGRKKTKNKGATDKLELTTVEKTIIKEALKTSEHHDSYVTVVIEAKRIADVIKASHHCVAFTGAGVSTSAGIGDYRGKTGKWTAMDRDGVVIDDDDNNDANNKGDSNDSTGAAEGSSPAKRARFNRSTSESVDEDLDDEGVPYDKLRPTYTHEALYTLLKLGYLKHVISQNGDGLHRLSGIPFDQLSELHGNVFLETCEKCRTKYERSYYVMDDNASLYYEELEDSGSTDVVKPKHAERCALCRLSHRTGRKCQKRGCNGYLKDSIINFGDNLEEEILDRATEESRRCDLFLCFGTTLRVTPAADLVDNMQEPQRYVVCNRQKTHLDSECVRKDRVTGAPLGSRVFGDCDRLMREVMKCLLPERELKEWEGGRSERMKEYDRKRDEC